MGSMLAHILLPIIYSLLFYFSFPTLVQFIFFVLGTFLGFQLLFLDRFVHAFYLYPNTEFNTLVRQLWLQGNYLGVIKALAQAETLQEKLLTRSALFLIVYLILTIFVLTSTGSVFGIGMMLGIGLHYTFDFWRYSQDTQRFVRHYFWQVKRSFTSRDVRVFVVSWTIIFTLVSLLVLL